jgi:hypothetical protein
MKAPDFTEGKPAHRFTVKINGVLQETRFKTREEAEAFETRADVNVEIFDGWKRVFGKPLPDNFVSSDDIGGDSPPPPRADRAPRGRPKKL